MRTKRQPANKRQEPIIRHVNGTRELAYKAIEGKHKWQTREANTEHVCRDGLNRSTIEIAVMAMEGRVQTG